MSEYKLLTKHFFKGTQKGQIKSLWQKKDIKERIEEYKRALAAGHVTLSEPLKKGEVKKLQYMGIEVPEHLKPKKKEKSKNVAVRLSNLQVKRMRELGVEPPVEMLPLRNRRSKAEIKKEVTDASQEIVTIALLEKIT